MSDGLAIISLLVSGWCFGLLTAFWWDDRTDRKAERDERARRAVERWCEQREAVVAATAKCSCLACDPNNPFMTVCSICGNKRCPHAANHHNTCTGSNEPGQIVWRP